MPNWYSYLRHVRGRNGAVRMCNLTWKYLLNDESQYSAVKTASNRIETISYHSMLSTGTTFELWTNKVSLPCVIRRQESRNRSPYHERFVWLGNNLICICRYRRLTVPTLNAVSCQNTYEDEKKKSERFSGTAILHHRHQMTNRNANRHNRS